MIQKNLLMSMYYKTRVSWEEGCRSLYILSVDHFCRHPVGGIVNNTAV